MKTPAILFIVFNRPDTTAIVFKTIRQARPQKLYLTADGPRANNSDDAKQCALTRDVLCNIDWPCKVNRLYHTTNHGCAKSISKAITWFFEHENEGIILEDDCLPHPEFFSYCGELLLRYRKNENIGVISGNNFQDGIKRGNASYYFSKYPNIWGWATWKRVWTDFNIDIVNSKSIQIYQSIESSSKTIIEGRYWHNIHERLKQGQLDSWAYPFTFHNWLTHRLSIVPNVNLVSNIGFDTRATHTQANDDRIAGIPTHPIHPIRHPKSITVDNRADKYYFKRNTYQPTFIQKIKSIMYSYSPQIFKKAYTIIRRKAQ